MVSKIISGGQTGADRGALEAAIQAGVAHGGHCPKGRLSEDGGIPSRYSLTETKSADYPERTRLNVVNSDGTVILGLKPKLGRGTELTIRICQELGKPFIVLAGSESPQEKAAMVVEFVKAHAIRVLNVAGSRESKQPGLFRHTRETIQLAITTQAGGTGSPAA
jgi:predicted Rossmann fold nucleotide-binding protein DprA/Smf involved in DNA uptake